MRTARRWGVIAVSIASAACATQTATGQQPAVEPDGLVVRPAVIGRSEEFILHSEQIGQDFLIQVAEPIYFDLPEPSPLVPEFLLRPGPDHKAPVFYVVDGFVTFGEASSSARQFPLEGLTTPAYVVAIGYPTADYIELQALRSRDLVHVSTVNGGQPFGGGGAAFEAFLEDELRPLIESRYPVDHERSVLAGHSLGGLFTATVLANDPEAFYGYVIGSPSLQFDPDLAGRLRAIASRGEGRRVFIGVGELEPASYADSLEAALTDETSTFEVNRLTLADETHVTAMGPVLARGLRHVLARAP